MQEMLRRMRQEREDGDRGFTLIELLVVVVIIGVLIAIAIPLYLNYRKGAENKSAQSDLRNSIATLEQCYADNNFYPGTTFTATGSSSVSSVAATAPCASSTIALTSGVTFTYFPVTGATTAGATAYTVYSSRNSGNYYCYNSANAGAVKGESTLPTTYAACP